MSLPLALLVGVLLSLAFLHLTGWSPGGLITPGYLLLCAADWRTLTLLVITAITTWVIVLVARRRLPLYGRRRWAFCIATAVMLRTVFEASAGTTVDPLGFIIPGLIASAAVQQGPGPTFTGLITVTAATWWFVILIGVL